MAQKGFTVEQLHAALTAEKVKISKEVLTRVWRKLDNPSGCEFCGQHVKVGEVVDGKMFTKCCGHAA